MGKLSAEEKMMAVRRRLEKEESFAYIAKLIGAGETTVRTWFRLYETMGSDAFTRNGHRRYSKEFKTAVAEYYLNGKGSLEDTCSFFRFLQMVK